MPKLSELTAHNLTTPSGSTLVLGADQAPLLAPKHNPTFTGNVKHRTSNGDSSFEIDGMTGNIFLNDDIGNTFAKTPTATASGKEILTADWIKRNYESIAVRYGATNSLSGGAANILFGTEVGKSITNGLQNTLIGRLAGKSITVGNNNTGIGAVALETLIDGGANIGIGPEALRALINGNHNIGIGDEAGDNATNINQSIFIGKASRAKNASGDVNEIVIGSYAQGKGSNTVVLGNDSITDTYLKGNVNLRNINSNTPTPTLQYSTFIIGSLPASYNTFNISAESYSLGLTGGNLLNYSTSSVVTIINTETKAIVYQGIITNIADNDNLTLLDPVDNSYSEANFSLYIGNPTITLTGGNLSKFKSWDILNYYDYNTDEQIEFAITISGDNSGTALPYLGRYTDTRDNSISIVRTNINIKTSIIDLSEVFMYESTGRQSVKLSSDFVPSLQSSYNLGTNSFRWNDIYSINAVNSISDARKKTAISTFTQNELNASKQLSKEIGTYKWLSAITEKGDAARKHIGMTVQRAIEIMTANNLNPFDYGFICYDSWQDEFKTIPAVEAKEAWIEEIKGTKYELVTTPATETEPEKQEVVEVEYVVETIEHPAIEAKDPYEIKIKEAGNIYSFRYTELLAFIAAGIEARLTLLENK